MIEAGDYGFSKDKIPASLGYPLKRSLLDAALDKAGVRRHVYSVRYLLGHWHATSPLVVDVMFQPEAGGHYHPSVAGRSLITVFAVPSQERKQVEDILVSQGLSLICNWLAEGASAGNVWRNTVHHLSLSVCEGALTHKQI